MPDTYTDKNMSRKLYSTMCEPVAWGTRDKMQTTVEYTKRYHRTRSRNNIQL